MMQLARRRLLALAATAPFAAISATRAIADTKPAACYDPNSLPLSQKTMRRGLSYAEISTDPAKHCSACAFFTAGAGSCGTCQLLLGGPVNGGAVCTSFAPKKA